MHLVGKEARLYLGKTGPVGKERDKLGGAEKRIHFGLRKDDGNRRSGRESEDLEPGGGLDGVGGW